MKEWLRRPAVLGSAAAVLTVIVGVVVVLLLTGGDDSDEASGASSKHTTTTSKPAAAHRSTTTTTAASGSSSSAPATTPSTAPAPPPPDPPDPADQYHPIPLPPGFTASITSCSWTPANGGELRATGAVTYNGTDDDSWFVEIYWLVHNQTQDEDINSQVDLFDIAPGQTIPWNLSTSQPGAPPNLSCALEVS